MIACICDMGSGFETAEASACLPLPHLMTREMVTRMGKMIDISNQRFGRLVAIEPAGTSKKGRMMWKCICDCGNIAIVDGQYLRRGDTKSCGCRRYDTSQLEPYRHKPHRKSNAEYVPRYDGYVKPVLYDVWTGMKDRCYNTRNRSYKVYGGKGIRVCEEWFEDFQVFNDWAVASGYETGLSIDRIDNDGNYCPENCRWVTPIEQANNKSNSHKIMYNGETHTIAEWSRISGMNYDLIKSRIYRGWSADEVFETPLGEYPLSKKLAQKGCIEFEGEKHTLREWAEITGLRHATIYKRLGSGWSIEDALTKPVKNQTKKVKS